MTGNSAKFIPAVDGRNRKVRGIVKRGERFYGRLWVDGKEGKKTSRLFPLKGPDGEPVQGVGEAREAYEVLRHDRRERRLPVSGAGRAPGFSAWVAEYLETGVRRSKKSSTLRFERLALERWRRFLGSTPLDRISRAAVLPFIEARRKGEWKDGKGRAMAAAGPRTVNLDLNALRLCLRAAVEAGRLASVPELKNLWSPPAERKRLISPGELARLVAAAPEACKRNGVQLAHFLRFLAASGAREQEALKIEWSEVDEENGQVWIGAGGVAKNRRGRAVDLNPALVAVLEDMRSHAGGKPGRWLFPSPRAVWSGTGFERVRLDRPARSLRDSLVLARTAAGLPWVGFHHLRHFFASRAVMSGIDFRTAAEWLGHRDGGVLIGKVYGHLCDEHKKRAAEKIKFE